MRRDVRISVFLPIQHFFVYLCRIIKAKCIDFDKTKKKKKNYRGNQGDKRQPISYVVGEHD